MTYSSLPMWVVLVAVALWCIPSVTGFTEGGCYEDHRKRMLSGPKTKFNDNSPSKCKQYCKDYKYYAVESEKECFCGNTVNYREPRSMSDCNKNCPGNKSKRCGGKWRLNIYTNYKNFDEILEEGACYSDHRDRVLKGPKKNFDYNDRHTCNIFCQGYKYYAVESEKECFCGNTIYNGLYKKPSGDCNKKCPGNNNEYCGGGWRMQIYRTSEAMTGENWMKYLDQSYGEKLVSALTLPGTHDTVATKVGLCTVGCVCQYRKITQQLEGGVRFLDIRLRHIKDKFNIFHGPIYLETNFEAILTAVTDFLKKNSQETVVMSYQEAWTDSCKDWPTQGITNILPGMKCKNTFWETLDSYLSNPTWSSYIYRKNQMPKLKDVRGKIVMLNFAGGYEACSNSDNGNGIRKSCGFSSSTVENVWEPDCDPANFINGGSNCNKYFNSLTANMDKAKANPDSKMFYITYTSANKFLHWRLQGPFAYAKYFNWKVRDYLKGKEGYYGAVVMDFIFKGINPEIIYGTNFKNHKYFNGGKTDGFPIALRNFPMPDSVEDEMLEETMEEEATE